MRAIFQQFFVDINRPCILVDLTSLIVLVLKVSQSGSFIKDICRRHGISEVTFYRWRSRFGGMGVSDAKRLRGLEAENARLKKLLAESVMDNSTLKEMLSKNF